MIINAIYRLCKVIFPLYKSVTGDVLICMWIKALKALTMSVSVFRGHILWLISLSKINIAPAAPDLEFILFPLWYWPTTNAHTKQQQDKVFETDFIESKIGPPICAPFGTKSCFYNNPAPVIRSTQFHYCTVSNPGSAACCITLHGLHTADQR